MTDMPVPSLNDPIVLTFPKGLLGFPQLQTYYLYEPQDGYPLKFLQSVDSEDISFTCMDPVGIKEDYTVPLSEEEAEALALESPADALILTIVVIPEDPHQMTTNLAGPLVINIKSLVGYQIALNTDRYPLRFPILPQS